MMHWTDSQNVRCMLKGGHDICTIFQAAIAASAKLKSEKFKSAKVKAKASGTTGTIYHDIETYAAKDMEAEFKNTSVLTSVALAERGNRKEKL